MEADVALHAPEAWVISADPRAEKIKYVYNNRRKEREGKTHRKASRIQQMKPSRSYDNDIATSIKADPDLNAHLQPPSVKKAKDDTSLKYAGQNSRSPPATNVAAVTMSSPTRKKGHSTSNFGYSPSRTKQSPEIQAHRDHHYPEGGRWRPRHRAGSKGKPPIGDRTKTESRRVLEKQSSLPETATGVSSTEPANSAIIPTTSADDQLQIFAKPKVLALDLDSNVSTRPNSSSSHGIMLKVKHGPTLHYKPSDTMLSDTSSLDCWGNTSSCEPEIYDPDERPLPALRGRRHRTFSEGAELGKSARVDRFPASTIQSALSTSQSNSVDVPHRVPLKAARRINHDDIVVGPSSSHVSKHDEIVVGPSSSPHVSKYDDIIVGPSSSHASRHDAIIVGPSPTHASRHDDIIIGPSSSPHVRKHDDIIVGPSSSPHVSKHDDIYVGPSSSPHVNKHDDIVVGPSSSLHVSHFDELPQGHSTQALSSFGALLEASDETAFSSPSVMFQQMAGIRHDDMVVGPVSRLQSRNPYTLSPDPTDSQNDVVSMQVSTGLSPVNHQAICEDVQESNPSSNATSQSTAVGCRDSESATAKELNERKASERDKGNSTICDSSSPSRGLAKLEAGEKRQRGMLLGSGIPLRRGGNHSLDRARGTSPNIGASPLARTKGTVSPPVTEDLNYGSSQSLPGSDDHVRWRPKDKKSGLHRMRREGKKEKNVSTESGYVTDQTLNTESADTKLGFSPERANVAYTCERSFQTVVGHSSLDRKPKQSRSKIPCSPSSRSKSSHTTSPPKKVVSSKGQPLSSIHIPIPICHDERVRKPSAKSSEPLEPPPRKESPALLVEGKMSGLDSLDSASQESIPAASSGPEPRPSTATGHHAVIQSRDTPSLLKSSSVASSSTASLPAVAALNVTPSSPIASSSTAKSRLHKSAEQLLANTKLTVYRGPDEGDQPDSASDISVATACSLPVVKKATQPNDDAVMREKARAKAQSSDIVDRTGLSKPKGRGLSLLRRQTERSTAIVRRGSDRAVPVDRNDPSALGLKAATSLKELCQSVASLLNIDNEKAAEMLSTSLSKRQDLVEGLDADAILDYLTHHGVLDTSILVGLGGNDEVSTARRNSAILRHVEELGDTAVALFINALRQSGQLHLASSLDTEQRIKPVCGNTYFGKSRHKGEICVRLQVEALKILAPREPTERNVNLSLLSSSLYGNDGPCVITDDEDDQVKPRSCLCFCFSRKRSSRSSSKKERHRKNKYKDAQRNEDHVSGPTTHSSFPSLQPQPGRLDRGDPTMSPHRTKSLDRNNGLDADGANGSNVVSSSIPPSWPSTPHSTPAKSVIDKKKNKKSKHKTSGKPDVPATIQESDGTQHSIPDVAFRSGGRNSDRSRSGRAKSAPKDLRLTQSGQNMTPSKRGGKDSAEGIIMEYDAQLELVKLRAGHDELASPTRQAGPVGILVEQWKSSGKHFAAKAEVLCQAIVDDFLTDIIKYFEQDRGTLVLDIESDGSAVVVFNICTTKAHVERLQAEHEDGRLLERLQELFTSKIDIAKFDIRGVQYTTVVDESQLESVLSELS